MIVTLKKDDALKTLASSHHPYERGYKISISCIVTQIQREVKKGGLMYTCKKCKANVDAGELVGGVCDGCREEEKKEQDIQYHFNKLVMATNFKQLELEELFK